ncbi:hypothetical protein LTR85_010342 [Meristemomyces frigidus]|nr:hypothetical protein LTR85_010342 [Meristemomyces frigidus]
MEADAHIDAIVIAVDGACRNNGRYGAESGYGVFVHRDSNLNESEMLGSAIHTSQRAELWAGLAALGFAKSIRVGNPIGRKRTSVAPGPERRLRRVVIKADSEYLVKGMTAWVYKWNENGFVNVRGTEVVNADLFRTLDRVVDVLNDLDVHVQFWHVPMQQNGAADSLAKSSLNDVIAGDAMDEYYG